MKLTRKTKIGASAMLLSLAALGTLTGCMSDADRASENTSKKAEHFEVQREIIGTNTRTGKALFHYVGRCSLESGSNSSLPGYLEIMCKHGPDQYRKHFEREATDTHISSNQLEPIDVSQYHTDIRIKPEQVVPQITVETGKQ